MTTLYTPSPIIVRTSLDEIGSLLDVTRIPGEKLTSYAKRLRDTNTNKASSTYDGLINGINRELNLNKKNLFTVDIRPVGFGVIDNNTISISTTTLTNNKTFSGLIDGLNVTASGTKLIDPYQNWVPKELRGHQLLINSVSYEIIDNTTDTVTINGVLTGLVGLTYSISANWLPNSLVGLGIKIGDRVFRIAENTSNIIRIYDGNLLETSRDEYSIQALTPKVEVTASKINLYKDYQNEENFQLEKTIDLRKDVLYHRDIVAMINELKFFYATDLVPSNVDIFARTLKKQSSENTVLREIIPSATFFKLKNSNVKEGSIKFSEIAIFLREVNEDQVSLQLGNYNVNYSQGIVLVNGLPSGLRTVSYTWNLFPLTIVSSPSIVNALANEDTQEFLFSQIEMRRYKNFKEKYISGQPSVDMIEFISELLEVNSQGWGK